MCVHFRSSSAAAPPAQSPAAGLSSGTDAPLLHIRLTNNTSVRVGLPAILPNCHCPSVHRKHPAGCDPSCSLTDPPTHSHVLVLGCWRGPSHIQMQAPEGPLSRSSRPMLDVRHKRVCFCPDAKPVRYEVTSSLTIPNQYDGGSDVEACQCRGIFPLKAAPPAT